MNECVQQSARAKEAVRSNRMSERCEQASEWKSEWPSTYVLILGCSAPLCSARSFSRSLRPGNDDNEKKASPTLTRWAWLNNVAAEDMRDKGSRAAIHAPFSLKDLSFFSPRRSGGKETSANKALVRARMGRKCVIFRCKTLPLFCSSETRTRVKYI